VVERSLEAAKGKRKKREVEKVESLPTKFEATRADSLGAFRHVQLRCSLRSGFLRLQLPSNPEAREGHGG
jgi:hypothetical protein